MQRLPIVTGASNLAGEHAATETQTSARQLMDSVQASTHGTGAGSIGNLGDHMAALPAFVFVVLVGGFLMWMIYKMHFNFAASFGKG